MAINSNNACLVLGVVFGLLFVLLGASIEHMVTANEILRIIMIKAQTYHLLHTVVILILGVLVHLTSTTQIVKKRLLSAGLVFSIAIVLFSGSLYLKVIASPIYMATIVPIGGVLFIVGWLILLFTFLQRAVELPREF